MSRTFTSVGFGMHANLDSHSPVIRVSYVETDSNGVESEGDDSFNEDVLPKEMVTAMLAALGKAVDAKRATIVVPGTLAEMHSTATALERRAQLARR